MSKRKVSYYYDPEIGNFYYGQGHPMKPHRVRMAHSLILRYGLYNQLDIFRPYPATDDVLTRFHSTDYVEFLKNVTPSNQEAFASQIKQYSIASDCPIFDRMFQYCQLYAGGSVGGAVRLNHGLSDVVINWAGGLHHAKKAEASGFCYVNDIVLAILELLKYHARVLYIDIDVHHGDGVEEAFLTTDRVLTVSFHKHGDGFFPGTGGLEDCGVGQGHYYAVNVPLQDGIDDDSYEQLFRPIMTKIMEQYQPGAVVLQSGADSLAGDRLGVFNLSIKGHGACHRLMKSFGVPLLVLGGGGYKIKNVARCWTYETAVLMGVEEQLDDALPPNEYYEYFAPDYKLHVPLDRDVQNQNRREQLDKLRSTILQNLAHIHPVSVPFYDRPPDATEANEAGPGRHADTRDTNGFAYDGGFGEDVGGGSGVGGHRGIGSCDGAAYAAMVGVGYVGSGGSGAGFAVTVGDVDMLRGAGVGKGAEPVGPDTLGVGGQDAHGQSRASNDPDDSMHDEIESRSITNGV